MKATLIILEIFFLLLISPHLYGQQPDGSMHSKELAVQFIESIREDLIQLSDSVWSFAEIGLEEYKSAKCLADYAERNGFKVERGIAGMPTAFIATYGMGKPIIGVFSDLCCSLT